MRRSIIATPTGPARPASSDPTDALQHGVAPRWKVDGHPGIANGFNLHNDIEVPCDGVRVRLPRRLSARTVPAGEAMRWIRGDHPSGMFQRHRAGRFDPFVPRLRPEIVGLAIAQQWELRYPGRGLGLPKRLPRRKQRPGYAPFIGIVGDMLGLDDQPICELRGIDVVFNREMVDTTRPGDVHTRWEPGRTTAKLTATVDDHVANAVGDAVRTVINAHYNGRPNLRATLPGGSRFSGVIVKYEITSDAASPRWHLRLDLDMVTVEHVAMPGK